MYKSGEKKCIGCNETYLGTAKSKYCSIPCANKYTHLTRIKVEPWNKGKKGVQTAWNKGLKGELSHAFGKKHTRVVKLTDEQRKRLSERLKGHRGYTTGMKFSVETKLKMSIAHRGENTHLWRGGITKIAQSIRGSFLYRQWRSDVFTRDKFTCQDCGVVGGALHADHIIPFAFILKKNCVDSVEKAQECSELWNLNNGRTLCVTCHKKTDTYLNRTGWFKDMCNTIAPVQPLPTEQLQTQ